MTDEERVRPDYAKANWPAAEYATCGSDRSAMAKHLEEWAMAIRADEREKCAQLIDDHDEGFKVSSGERFLTARSEGNRSGLAYAAAIRAMGDKG